MRRFLLAILLLTPGLVHGQEEFLRFDRSALVAAFHWRVGAQLPLEASGAFGEAGYRSAQGSLMCRAVPARARTVDGLLRKLESFDSSDAFSAELLGDQLLVVRGTPEDRARYRARLDFLHRMALRMVRVTVFRLPTDALREVPGPIVSAEELPRLLERHPPRGQEALSLRLGNGAQIVAARRRATPGDFDVQVMGSLFADPRMTPLLLGLQVGVDVHEVGGGRHLLRLGGRHGKHLDAWRREVRTILPDREGPHSLADIEMHHLRSAAWSAAAVLGPGEALLAGRDAHGPLLWRVEGEDSAAGSRRHEDLEVVATAPLGLEPPGALLPPSALASYIPAYPDLSFGEPSKPRSTFPPTEMPGTELLTHPLRDGELPGTPWIQGLLLQGSASEARELREHLESLRRNFAATVTLDIRTGLLPREIPIAPTELEKLLPRLTERTLLSTLETWPFGAAFGEERHYLGEYDIEIGRDLAGPDPVVRTLFTGTSIDGRVSRVGSRRVAFEGRIFRQILLGQIERYAIGSHVLSAIDLPDVAHATLEGRFDLDIGTWTLLGLADLPRTDHRFVALARVAIR